MKYIFNDNEYELVKNFREGFILEEVELRWTDYFDEFDYVLGDWAYGKLRLKGFYEKDNKIVKEFNDIQFLEKYIEEQCATGCKYFLLKKINKNI